MNPRHTAANVSPLRDTPGTSLRRRPCSIPANGNSIQNPYKSDHFNESQFSSYCAKATYNFTALKCTDFRPVAAEVNEAHLSATIRTNPDDFRAHTSQRTQLQQVTISSLRLVRGALVTIYCTESNKIEQNRTQMPIPLHNPCQPIGALRLWAFATLR